MNIDEAQIGSTVLMSAEGYQNLINAKDGKDLHWTTEINTELPIKMASHGHGATIKPETMPTFFKNTALAEANRDRIALNVMRNKKIYTWTWG